MATERNFETHEESVRIDIDFKARGKNFFLCGEMMLGRGGFSLPLEGD